MKLALLITDLFPNLRDTISRTPCQKITLGKTMRELKAVSVKESLVRAMRNRRFRKPVCNAPLSPNEQLKNFRSLGLVTRKKLLLETLQERNETRDSNLSEFVGLWPFLNSFDGIVAEFIAMRSIKNIDYAILRIKRALRNTTFTLLLYIVILF